MGQLDAAIRYIGTKKQKHKTVWQAQTAATTATQLAKSYHEAFLDDDCNGSDGYISSSDKENDDMAVLLQEKERERDQEDGYKKQFYNTNKQAKYWQKMSKDQSANLIEMKRGTEHQNKDLRHQNIWIQELSGQISQLEDRVQVLGQDKTRYQKELHALKAKVKRIPQRLATILKKAAWMFGVKERGHSFKLKDKGIILDEAQDIFCDLVALYNDAKGK